MDPEGSYGIAVVEVAGEAEARSLAENDPAIKSNAGFNFKIYEMPDAMVRQ
jgi:hypothetical protein